MCKSCTASVTVKYTELEEYCTDSRCEVAVTVEFVVTGCENAAVDYWLSAVAESHLPDRVDSWLYYDGLQRVDGGTASATVYFTISKDYKLTDVRVSESIECACFKSQNANPYTA